MPLLTLALHLPIHVAIGSSLIAIVATSCTASGIYMKNQLTNVKLGLLLGTATTPGAIVGALVAAIIVPSVLSILFGLILIYTAYTMVANQSRTDSDTIPEGNITKLDDTSTNLYYDQSLDKIVTYKLSHIPQGLTASFFAGFISSLLGIGGGIINVPVMNLVMGVPMKATIATSSFIIAITSTVGALVYYYQGYLYPGIAGPLIIGVVLGALLGTQLTQRAKGSLLRRIFSALLFATATLMFLRAANIM